MIPAVSKVQGMCSLDSSIKFSASEDIKSISCPTYQLHESNGYGENHFIVTKHLIIAKQQHRWSVRLQEDETVVNSLFTLLVHRYGQYNHIFGMHVYLYIKRCHLLYWRTQPYSSSVVKQPLSKPSGCLEDSAGVVSKMNVPEQTMLTRQSSDPCFQPPTWGKGLRIEAPLVKIWPASTAFSFGRLFWLLLLRLKNCNPYLQGITTELREITNKYPCWSD